MAYMDCARKIKQWQSMPNAIDNLTRSIRELDRRNTFVQQCADVPFSYRRLSVLVILPRTELSAKMGKEAWRDCHSPHSLACSSKRRDHYQLLLLPLENIVISVLTLKKNIFLTNMDFHLPHLRKLYRAMWFLESWIFSVGSWFWYFYWELTHHCITFFTECCDNYIKIKDRQCRLFPKINK